jgi:hypothetical protein
MRSSISPHLQNGANIFITPFRVKVRRRIKGRAVRVCPEVKRGISYSDSKSKMISRRQGRGDAGVFFIRRGADDDANEDSALILNPN